MLCLLASFLILKISFYYVFKLTTDFLAHAYLLLLKNPDFFVKKQIFLLKGNKRDFGTFVVSYCLNEANHALRCFVLKCFSNCGGLEAQCVLSDDDQPSPLLPRLLVWVDGRRNVLIEPVFDPICYALN